MPSKVSSNYSALTREQLATLVPELLLAGHLIDRAGMAYCIQSFGRPEMLQVAIEEWMAASPVYTKRMQRALGFEGTDVVTIFKGMQFDVGAPPQFMDFRYVVHDENHGEFWLDHCGALMDVEPMGAEYVKGMCHDIEDPTFDATAVATNPRTQVRPIHRPPRVPSDRKPHCAWRVTIDESFPALEQSQGYRDVVRSRAATLELDPIDRSDDGMADYSGPMLSDLDFPAFSHSALVRIADEVALQSHLLSLGFVWALRQRADQEEVERIVTKQVTGIAGVAARRLHAALGLERTPAGAARVLSLHPLLNPAAYVATEPGPDDVPMVSVLPSPAHDDDGWLQFVGPRSVKPLQAIVQAIDPTFDVEVVAEGEVWHVRVVQTDVAAAPMDEVVVTDFSTGSAFEFEPRLSLPITPV